MKTTKRILTAVAATAALLSLTVVGAGAAFTDQNDIKYTDAVSACTALQIISGYPDNSFRPDGTITRGQMCKMLTIALNGGKEPDLSQQGNSSFPDVVGNWAEPYIKYCTSKGLVDGISIDRFAPDKDVTGVQAAKMLLIALGYDTDKEGFSGPAWSVNVNVRAQQADLFSGLDFPVSKAISRENAAQMIVNALQASKVEYSEKTEIIDKVPHTGIVCTEKLDQDGKTPLTLLKEAYGMTALPSGK